MSKIKSTFVSNSGAKRKKLTPLQIGALVSLFLVICCLCSVGISLVNGNKATPTQASAGSSAKDLPTILPQTTTAETDPGPTQITATESAPSTIPIETTAPVDSPTLVVPSSENPLRVHFVDVGQGDSILIQAPDGKTGLIDGGEANTGIVQYLQMLGISHLDFVLATHPHSDHIGGLVQVLQVIPVDVVYTNGMMHTTLTYEHFLDAISESRAEYVELKRGDAISLGWLTFEVLSLVPNNDEDLNNGSLVLRLVYGKVSFLFTGDAEVAAEESMLSSGLDLTAIILKVAHHGSRTSSTPAFLAQVKPEVAIYTAGIGNDFGHPHTETIAALTALGAKIYGTDVNGTIIVTTNGSGYSIETEKQGQVQAPPVVQPTVLLPVTTSIDVVSLTSPISPGGQASLTIKTAPGAACTITVYYKSGASQAQGLGPQTANNDGNVTWGWKVGTRTTPGTWRIVVTANINGQMITNEIQFVVQK